MIKHSGLSIFWLISSGVGLIGILLLLLFPEISLAATSFQPLVGIPGVTENPEVTENFGLYINALYILAITIGAMLAVLKLIAAGVKYMFSDIVTTKAEAKNDIKGALLGLLIVVGAVVMLNTINTDLTDVKLNIAPAGANIKELLKERMKKVLNECTEENECVMEECWLVDDTYGTCEAWCYRMGGRFLDTGFLDYWIDDTNRDKCLRPFNDEEKCRTDEHTWVDQWWPKPDYCQNIDPNRKTEIIGCDPTLSYRDSIVFIAVNCNRARNTCTALGGDSLSPEVPQEAAVISCSLPPGVSVVNAILQCEPITSTSDPDDSDCTDAEAECTGVLNGSIVDDTSPGIVKCLLPPLEERLCTTGGGSWDETIEVCLFDGEILQTIAITITCHNAGGCVAINGIDNPLGVAEAEGTCAADSSGLGLLTVTSPIEGICAWATED